MKVDTASFNLQKSMLPLELHCGFIKETQQYIKPNQRE